MQFPQVSVLVVFLKTLKFYDFFEFSIELIWTLKSWKNALFRVVNVVGVNIMYELESKYWCFWQKHQYFWWFWSLASFEKKSKLFTAFECGVLEDLFNRWDILILTLPTAKRYPKRAGRVHSVRSKNIAFLSQGNASQSPSP